MATNGSNSNGSDTLTRSAVEELLGRKLTAAEASKLKANPITAEQLAPKSRPKRETPLTAEERSQIAKRAAAKRTAEERAESARRAAVTRKANRDRTTVEALLA